ncbi:MAG: Gfo/Idh/MocA family oxidoreductase, partial [Gemmatimonadetes bacterium]|nr:Gfo/Idh/MocA family oxidoreductase [Gemmatimonadota bacterium]
MLQIGIVGLGGIGNNHARCYTANKYSKLVAVCDVIKEKADAAAEQYGAQAFYSVKQMLKSGIKLDGCSVTTAGVENGSDHYNPTMEL